MGPSHEEPHMKCTSTRWPDIFGEIRIPTRQDFEDNYKQAARDFLTAEASMLDAGQLQRWLSLFSDEALYWAPMKRDAESPDNQLNLIYDDQRLLQDRIYRVETGDAHSQDPPSRTVRAVSNVYAEYNDHKWIVRSVFNITEVRNGVVNRYMGRYTHILRVEESRDGAIAIAKRRVDLIQSDHVLPNLSFIV